MVVANRPIRARDLLLLCYKTMWFIGVEVEQETSAPPPKKILDPPLYWHQDT